MRAVLALLLTLIFTLPSDAIAAGKPNIVIIMADDLGYSDIGCYGSEIETPNLDSLAKGGLRFSQFYNTARCWPTRAAVMTGYYPQQVRMDPQQRPKQQQRKVQGGGGGQAPGRGLPEWTRTLPQYLKPAGYYSYHSGKWHVGAAPRVVQDGGFEHSYVLDDHNRNFNPQAHKEDDVSLPPVQPGTGYYTSTAITDYALKYLRGHATEHGSAPFFLYLAYTVPHFPLQAPEADIAKYRYRYKEGWDVMRQKRFHRLKEMGLTKNAPPAMESEILAPSGDPDTAEKLGPVESFHAVPWNSLSTDQQQYQAEKMAIHAAMIDRMDQEIGRVLAQPKAMNAAENTLIFFLSDNGASAEILVRGDGHDATAPEGSAKSFLCLGPGWSSACNTPFRRHKIWVHEGGISTPLIVNWPAGIPAKGELRHDVSHAVDLVPTVLELAGIAPARGAAASVADTGTDAPTTPAPPFPGVSLAPAIAKDGTVKRDYVYFNHQGNNGLRIGDWKIVRDGPNKPWELYDMASDRGESNNLASKHADRVAELDAVWQAKTEEFKKDAAVAEVK